MNPEKSHPYNDLPDDSEIVRHYKPTFLARGGDHLVYAVEEHPDVVFKASSFAIKDSLSASADAGEDLDSIPDDEKTRLEEGIAKKTAQARILREYFGASHTVNERRYIMKVPVSKAIIDEIFKGDWKKRKPPAESKKLTEAWSTVVIQERIPELADPSHLGFYFGGFLEERGQIDAEEYTELNNSFVPLCQATPDDVALFLRLQDNPKTHALTDLIAKTESDPNLKSTTAALVLNVISYANETGNILALAGEDNVILFNKDGKWDYLLIDALPIHDEPVFEYAKQALHRHINNEDISEHEMTLIMKALNFVRTVNGVATTLDLPERLRMILPEDENKEIDFKEFIKDNNHIT